MGAVVAVVVALDQGHRGGEPGEVERTLVGDDFDVGRRAPAERSEGQQGQAIARREAGDDLLEQELRRRVDRGGEGQPDQRRPATHPVDPRQPVGVRTQQVGEGRRFVVGERQVVDADVDHLSGRPEPG